MNVTGQFLRDIALQGLTSKGAKGAEFLPLSVGAFNLLIQEGFEPLKAGLLCDSRIAANPFLALDEEHYKSVLDCTEYLDDALSWGKLQLGLLEHFVPPPKKTNGQVIDNRQTFMQCVKPWTTSVFEQLVHVKESIGDLNELAEEMRNHLK